MLEELQAFPHWLCHNGDKIPRRIKDKQLASPTNPDDWASWQDAMAFMQINANAGWGLGFVITKDTGLTCIDLDRKKALSVEVNNFQSGIFNTFSNTYAEFSVSGKGAHIWIKGTYVGPDGKYGIRNDDYETEVYSHARYMAMSFNPIPGRNLPINAYESELNALIDSLRSKANIQETSRLAQLEHHSDDVEIHTYSELNRILLASNSGDKWRNLVFGNYELAGFKSQSEADQSFFSLLASVNATPKQAKKMYYDSALSKREKAHRKDYVDRCLLKAFGDKVPIVELPESPFDETDHGTTVVQHQWSKPPGLLGDIINYIYSSSIRPNLEVSISGAVALLSAICGRSYNTPTGIGLNQYFVLVGRSGIGKEASHKGISSLISAVRREHNNPFAELFMGPSIAASATGLLRAMAEQPFSKLIVTGEIGHWFQQMNGRHTNENAIQLKRVMLDIYNKSGYGSAFTGSRYANSKDNIPIIESPSLTLFGESTPDEFFKGIDEGSLAEGLVSRLTTIHCPDDIDYAYNYHAGSVTPVNIDGGIMLTKLDELITHCATSAAATPHCITLTETPEAKAFADNYLKMCDNRMKEQLPNNAQNIWYRAHLRMLKLGAVVAIGCAKDLIYPVIELEHYKWAADLINEGMNNLVNRFVSGNVGEVSHQFEQRRLIEEVLFKFSHIEGEAEYKRNLKFLNSIGADRLLNEKKIVKKGYINRYLRGYNAFKQDRNMANSVVALWRQLEGDGVIDEVPFEELITLVGRYAKREQYYRVNKFRKITKKAVMEEVNATV